MQINVTMVHFVVCGI